MMARGTAGGAGAEARCVFMPNTLAAEYNRRPNTVHLAETIEVLAR
jgi:hypothetical protein